MTNEPPVERKRGGDKGAATMRRQIILLQRLNHGPASRQELIDYVRNELGDDAYGADETQALQRDLNKLREYECVIVYDRGTGTYAIESLGLFGQIAFPSSELETLAQLRELYRVPAPQPGLTEPSSAVLPFPERVNRLLNHLVKNLGWGLREGLKKVPARLQVAGGMVRRHPLTEQTLRKLEELLGRKQQIAFDYRSLFTVSAQPVRHEVSPFDMIFRDGHFYLVAFMHRNDRSREFAERWVDYRVDRIVLQSLVELRRPVIQRPPRPEIVVKYHLHSDIAGRNDFKVAIEGESTIELQTDHSAIVTVRTKLDLFLIRQLLLRYGARCVVLEPKELVRDMQREAQAMAKHYEVGPAQ